MNGTVRNGNGDESAARKRRTGLAALLFALAAVSAVVWWVRSGDLDRARASLERERDKLDRMTALVRANRRLLRSQEKADDPGRLGSRSAVSLIREIAASCGIAENLIRVVPEENRKKGEMTAKVMLKGVRIREVVRFLVELRARYPQMYDREARLRLASRTEDRWDAGLALTYPE